MTQAAGRSWHVVTKLLAGSSRYEVRTPASTASVRGTEFEVDVEDVAGEPVATITTTEGRVIHSAPDPARPGQTTSAVVTPGTTSSARRGHAVEQPRAKPADARTVTVRVGSPSSLVVDPLGRANGVRADGKVVAQTPGARVERGDGSVVVTLPNVPDGKIGAHVDAKDAPEDVTVTTTVADRGGEAVVVTDDVRTRAGRGRAGVDVRGDTGTRPDVRPIAPPERASLPSPKAEPTPRRHGGSAGPMGLPAMPIGQKPADRASTPRPSH
jgi:hypothetical protein